MNYLRNLSRGKVVLWCYLLWYLFFVRQYFDPSPTLWLTSLGISGVIGIALFISSTSGQSRLDRWQVFRLFLMPFCVSSFSALVKGHEFVMVFAPDRQQNLGALALCLGFAGSVALIKQTGAEALKKSAH